MRAEVLSIGTELLLGEVVDTNSAWLSEQLADAGFDVYWSQRVGDNLERAVHALRQALARSGLVVTTGGLGSTDDDLTRDAVAAVVGETQFVDPALEAHLRDWFERAGTPYPALMSRQASRIESAEPLPNRVGTAPGWLVRTAAVDGSPRFIVTLPGPPREAMAMWTEQARPRLPHPTRTLLRHTFKTFGLGEGRVFEELGDLVKPFNPSVSTYTKRDGVHVRVGAQAPDAESARRLAEPVCDAVRARLGPFLWGENEDSLVGVIAARLRARGSTLATIESLTGGQIAREIVGVAGVSDVFLGGVVAYDAAVKVKIGVPREIVTQHGVVSEATAHAMASACAAFMGATYALASTGVAGPAELEGHPAGTVFLGLHGPNGVEVAHLQYAARSRDQIRERATFAALAMLWKHLREVTDPRAG